MQSLAVLKYKAITRACVWSQSQTAFYWAFQVVKLETARYYILGREPQPNKDKEHQLWTQIRASKFLEFVDIEEVGIVEEYITNNNVQPFFER